MADSERKSPAEEKAHGSKKSSLLLAALIASFLLSSLLFMAYWETNSTNQNYQIQPSFEYANGSLIDSEKTKITIDNYFPFLPKHVLLDVYKFTSYSENQTIPQMDLVHDLKAENITINQITSEITYGDSTIRLPMTFSNPPGMEGFFIPRMSRNTITVDWKYETTQPNYSLPQVSYSVGFKLIPETGLSFESLFNPVTSIFPSNIRPLIIGVFFFLACTFTGFISVMYALRNRTNLKNGIKYMSNFDCHQAESNSNVSELTTNVQALKYGPNLLGGPSRLFLGLSLLIFKLRVSILCKYQRDKCIIGCNEKFEKAFALNADVTDSKVSDLIPEKQTILALIGVLTSVGVSLSFNVGAIAPVLLSIGAFYVFLNIGSTFYLNGKTKDVILPLVLLFIAIAALSAQNIFLLLRT